jgi:chemotaxis protein CheX
MNVQYINAILDAIKHTFMEMLEFSIKFNNPVVKTEYHPRYEVSVVLTLSGDLTGCIALNFPTTTVLKIASEFTGHIIEDLPEAADAIREIANMVSGQADTELQLKNVSYSLPSVHIGNNLVAYTPSSTVFSMDCLMDKDRFEIDIALYKESRQCKGNEIC